MNYKIIYSDRKTLAITVKDAEVVVRSPRGVTEKVIKSFVEGHKTWIDKKLKIQVERMSKEYEPSAKDISKLKDEARAYFTEKSNLYADIMGLKFGRIKITSAKRRFGSCNTEGTICFSYRLMLYPERAREYVVVHELAHLKHMNHSADFYKLVEKYMPDYKERKRLLK